MGGSLHATPPLHYPASAELQRRRREEAEEGGAAAAAAAAASTTTAAGLLASLRAEAFGEAQSPGAAAAQGEREGGRPGVAGEARLLLRAAEASRRKRKRREEGAVGRGYAVPECGSECVAASS